MPEPKEPTRSDLASYLVTHATWVFEAAVTHRYLAQRTGDKVTANYWLQEFRRQYRELGRQLEALDAMDQAAVDYEPAALPS